MGPIQQEDAKLFHYGIVLEQRVRGNNPLRAISKAIDFSFVRDEVGGFYGKKGHQSEDPIVIMKLMLLLFLDDHPSERELMRVVAERLDYMWFLGFGLDDEIPHHSVLSKGRRRWGKEVFERVFIRTVQLCVESGLVEGKKIYLDGTLINGNASKDSVKRGPAELIEQLRKIYRQQEEKLNEPDDEGGESVARVADRQEEERQPGSTAAELTMVSRREFIGRRSAAAKEEVISRTDIDTAVVRKGVGDGARPRYKNHRAVDDLFGVITAIETTPGDVAENTKLFDLVEQHEHHTRTAVETVVGDTQYGTNENFAECQRRGIRSHMSDLKSTYRNDVSAAVFGEDQFHYDASRDRYTCPAGETLEYKHVDRGLKVYAASSRKCHACPLRAQCTRSKAGGRRVKRHPDHELIERARLQSRSDAARRDRRRRRHLMEGSFADGANNHGLKRARWRGLAFQQTQDWLIATCQNLRLFVRFGLTPTPVKVVRKNVPDLVRQGIQFCSADAGQNAAVAHRELGFHRVLSVLCYPRT
jgi:transposase